MLAFFLSLMLMRFIQFNSDKQTKSTLTQEWYANEINSRHARPRRDFSPEVTTDNDNAVTRDDFFFTLLPFFVWFLIK